MDVFNDDTEVKISHPYTIKNDAYIKGRILKFCIMNSYGVCILMSVSNFVYIFIYGPGSENSEEEIKEFWNELS